MPLLEICRTLLGHPNKYILETPLVHTMCFYSTRFAGCLADCIGIEQLMACAPNVSYNVCNISQPFTCTLGKLRATPRSAVCQLIM